MRLVNKQSVNTHLLKRHDVISPPVKNTLRLGRDSLRCLSLALYVFPFLYTFQRITHTLGLPFQSLL